jgi:hypothetical protein
MDIAALILSSFALVCSLLCLAIMLAKNFFSTHQVQMYPVSDPFKDMMGGEIGKGQLHQFQDLDLNLSQEDIDQLRGRQTKFKG